MYLRKSIGVVDSKGEPLGFLQEKSCRAAVQIRVRGEGGGKNNCETGIVKKKGNANPSKFRENK